MSFQATTQVPVERTARNGHNDGDGTVWRDRTRLVLTPIAAPSILGLFGFAGATFIVAAYLANWYGTAATPFFLFPFALFFGGLAQLVAGFFSYRARDGLATAMHGMWGSFWLAWGTIYLLGATGAVTVPTGVNFTEMGFWFVALAAITWLGAVAATRVNAALLSVLVLLAVGSTLAAIAFLAASTTLLTISGYVLVASAVAAWYTAGALMINGTFRQDVLPLGHLDRHVRDNRMTSTDVIEYPIGMPGAHAGQ
jgi:succinate-acetate transporter protein